MVDQPWKNEAAFISLNPDNDHNVDEEANEENRKHHSKQNKGLMKADKNLCITNQANVDENKKSDKSKAQHQIHNTKD